MTPEGRIKNAINKTLKGFPGIYRFMPVPSGYGKSSLDYILCVRGDFLAIEAKAPGKQPTPRQWQMIYDIQGAGGLVLVIDSIEAATTKLRDTIVTLGGNSASSS